VFAEVNSLVNIYRRIPIRNLLERKSFWKIRPSVLTDRYIKLSLLHELLANSYFYEPVNLLLLSDSESVFNKFLFPTVKLNFVHLY
jgi:hypothetical protein